MDTTEMIDPVVRELIDEQQLAEQLTKRVLETPLEGTRAALDHLGHDKHHWEEMGKDLRPVYS